MSVLLAAAAAVLFGVGTYLVLQRKLSRVIVGVGLLTHGANVLLVSSGRRGHAPLVGEADPATFADPFPQFVVLTAILIGFGVTALLLAFAYRSWLLSADDEIADDVEDRWVARHRSAAATSTGAGDGTDGDGTDGDGADGDGDHRNAPDEAHR